ncbi:EF-hand calcium-binding domain-containing protein 1 [Tribolium madens]|uniref:EF-hand calcium-binding domain-containing protein 1 n=1 Tax=Tribolium madens TaxID=41895 RepID=UPI001CF738D6|nr:EF-hand calcium-binding domain-containing protein 1 [Tribolium madens]
MASGVSGLSMRGGLLVMKSVSLFLAGNRSSKGSSAQPAGKPAKPRRKKMSEQDIAYRCSMKILEAAKRDTLFTRGEIEALYKIFRKLVTMNKTKSSQGKMKTNANPSSIIGKPANVQEGIDRIVFREILHNTFDIVAENMLMDRIFCVWDKANYGLITLEAWLHGLSLLLRGSTIKQIEFCFAVYDLNADGFITKDEMFQLLRNCLIKHPQEEDPDEAIKDLVDIVMRKMDKDKDGKVSLEDFQATVTEEPLLLEAFGKCLPSERSKNTFLSTLKA